MPYIGAGERAFYDDDIARLAATLEERDFPAGDVNYVFCRVLHRWWQHKPRYMTICLVIGMLVCAALEFYWKVARRYEDKKCEENGEVFI